MSRLHWYGPKSHGPRASWHTPPLRRARYRLYVPNEQYVEGSHRYRRDRTGTYVWLGTDCGWEWLQTRPVLSRIRPWWNLMGKLHEHVHTPGAW